MFSERENIIIELCVRMVLGSLLDRDGETASDFTAGLHNLNIGCFGDKNYKFEDTNDWISCLKDMRSIISTLDPEYKKKREDLGCKDYLLEEEVERADWIKPDEDI